jgi:competence ComEA-like helix-hairpin-helix protein
MRIRLDSSHKAPAHLCFVAQICNLLYRRFAIGKAINLCQRARIPDTRQNGILRYSRVKICATSQTAGSVLVGLLWCMALLSIVVIGVLHTARLDLMVVKTYGDRIQARYLALAGVERAKALLYQDAQDRKRARKNHTGYLYDTPEQFQDVPLGRGKFSVFRAAPDGGSDPVYGITDEEGRLNLNQAKSEELAKLNGVTPDIVAAITDWKDDDNNVSPGGAEAEYYMGLKPQSLPRNAPFQTVRELLMVRGISREALYADDVKQNGLLPREVGGAASPLREKGASRRDASSIRDAGLADILTVDGWTENVNVEGEDRVNIQTADEKALSSIQGLTRDMARAIVAHRNQNKFDSIAELLDVRAATSGTSTRTTTANQSAATGPKVISEDLFLEIADSVTTQNNRELAGLVNINTGSAQVLACLPGISPELAQAIVSYRASDGFFPNIAWLLKVPGMSRDIFKQVANRITARSETFRITSEGKMNSSGVRQRIQMIVHVGEREVRTLAYREDM